MPKQPTIPTLYDNAKVISIELLRKKQMLQPNTQKRGVLTWSVNGVVTGSVSFIVNIQFGNGFIDLAYYYNKKPVNYRIRLISIPSNLGKGVIWYFLCPKTNKLCRKLYLIDTYFLHREAFRGCMYEKQTLSKKNRYFDKQLGAYFEKDQLYQTLYSKYFKKTYAGKPTKRYLKLMEKIQRADSISYLDIEQAMLY